MIPTIKYGPSQYPKKNIPPFQTIRLYYVLHTASQTIVIQQEKKVPVSSERFFVIPRTTYPKT